MTLEKIQEHFQKHATEKSKASTKKFVPDAVKIYGNTMPQVNALADRIAKHITTSAEGFQLIQQLWESGAYEEKVLAAKLIRKYCKKDPLLSIQLVEQFSKDISDWAVCDTLGMQSLKPINLKYQKEIFSLSKKISTSKNLWQRRLSLVLLEDFCKQKDLHAEIKKRIAMHKNDTEYYMKKAVVWLEASISKKRN